jgi:hypothetical protein
MEKLLRYSLIYCVIICSCFIKVSAQYCFPKTTRNPSYGNLNFYIDRVRLGDIDNQDSYTPADTSYNDYTPYGPFTILTRGLVYSMKINTGPNPTYPTSLFYAAWIDYNNDGDFSDAGENLFQQRGSVVSEEITKSITIPASASISKTRLRIRCTYYNGTSFTVDPCAIYTYGETEDYTVGISDFAKVVTTIPGAWDFNLDFFNIGDDNDYDLIMLDEYDDLVPINFFNNNGAGTYTANSTLLGAVSPAFKEYNMSYSLCDLNNDNRLDLLLTSRNNSATPRTTYFQNNGSQLIQTTTGIADLMWGSTATADFNNDGKQDIIICGRDAGNIPHTYIYKNTGSGYSLINDKLKGVYGEIAVADYDNDKDIDILLTGNDRYGNTNSIIYRNDNNWKFTDIYANIYKYSGELKPQFCDFNNDGRLDLLCGKAYRNDGNGLFTEIPAHAQYDVPYLAKGFDIDNDGILEIIGQDEWGVAVYKYNGVDSLIISQHLMGLGRENLDVADINSDNKPDIIVNDNPAYIFRNLTATTNTAPTAPYKFATAVGDSGFYSVVIRWSGASDDKTPLKGLSYNLRVGTTSGGNEVFSSMTYAPTGKLLKPGMGNVYKNTVWFLKDLPPGNYYWSVQAVDNSGLASAFSTEQPFQILEPLVSSTFLAQGRVNTAAGGADFDGDKDIDLIIRNTDLEIHQQTALNTYSIKTVRANSDILAIADMNNDNFPDIIARHNKIFNQETFDSLEIFINNKNFTFSVFKLDTISAYSVAVADFDNDGDNDILAHDRGYFLYENKGSNQYTRNTIPINGTLYRTSISSIDIDKDGDNDFMIAGRESNLSSSRCQTLIFKNNGNKDFSLSQTIVPGIGPSAFQATSFAGVTNPADMTWNDLNFDGYPDLLLTGDDEYRNNTCQILLNDGTGQLVLTSLSPRPADKFSPAWLDFNTDGYLDIIMPKIGWNTDNTIYFNENNTSYTGFANAIDAFNTAMYLKPVDTDQDKDKDILCTYKIPVGVDGYRMETKIYTNTNNFVNQAPNPPTTTSSQIDVFDVVLNWNNGWDKLTGNNGLSYNIWVGTANNKADIISPLADLTTGYRFVEALGNVGTNTSWRIKNLPLGTYYWSVQTIDNSMTPSAWAPVKSFTLSALTASFSNDEVCLGFDTHLTDNSVTTHPITSWKWIIGGRTVSTSQNPVFRFTTSGNNIVKLVVESSVAKDSITKTVYVKPIPEAAFTNNTVCAGSATSFTNSTIANGLTMTEWHWDFGDNSGSNVQNPGTHGYLIAGTYNAILVAVADNGCSDTIKKTVEVGLIPTAAITLSGPPNFCSGDSVKLANSYTDTYIYSWQTGGSDITGGTNNTYTAKLTGIYTIKVTNPVGNCFAVSTPVNVTVKESPLQPAISYSGQTVFCAGDSLLLTVPQTGGLTYNWKLNGGSIGGNTYQHAARIDGTYHILVTNSDGCTSGSTNSVEVKVNDKPAATSLSIPLKTELCAGESVVLGVTSFPNYGYQWLNNDVPVPGAIGNTLRITESGKYLLEISNAKGCSIRTNAINISVNARPVKPLIDSANYKDNDCIGETPLKLSVKNIIAGYSYQWYKNGAPLSSQSFIEDFFDDGYYYAEADLNGCKSSSDSVSLDFRKSLDKPDINATGTNVWYLTTSSEAKYYKWYLDGVLIPEARSKTYIAGQKLGTYRVSVSNDNDCFRISDPKTIPSEIVGIEDPDPFEDVKIYPNPTTGMFTIEMNNNVFGEIVIDIITQNGSKILNIKFEKTTEHFSSQIDLSGQAKGMYLINLSLDKFRAVRKVLVE